MQIEYELTQQDFVESFSAHRNRTSLRRWIRRFLMSIVLVLAAVLVLAIAARPNAQNAKALTPVFVLVLLEAGIFWILPRYSAYTQFSKQPRAKGPRTVLMDDEGVHWRWNGGSSDVSWKNYVRALEGKTQILLYTSPVCFNIIPKRCLSPEVVLELRTLLKQNLPNG